MIYRYNPVNSFVSDSYKKGCARKQTMKEMPRYENDKKLRADKSSLGGNCIVCTCGKKDLRTSAIDQKDCANSVETEAFRDAREDGYCGGCEGKNAITIGNCRSSINILLPNPGLESLPAHKENILFNKIYAQHISHDYANVMNQINEENTGQTSAVSEAEIAEIVAASRQSRELAGVMYEEQPSYPERRRKGIAEELKPEYVPLDQTSRTYESSSYEYEGYYTDLGHVSENESFEEMFRSSYSSDETPDPKIWCSRRISSRQKLKIDKLNMLSIKKHGEDAIVDYENGYNMNNISTNRHADVKGKNLAGDKESYQYLDNFGTKNNEKITKKCLLNIRTNNADTRGRTEGVSGMQKTDGASSGALEGENLEENLHISRSHVNGMQKQGQNLEQNPCEILDGEKNLITQDKKTVEPLEKTEEPPHGQKHEYSFMLADDVVQNKNILLERIKKKIASKLSEPESANNNESFIIRKEATASIEKGKNQDKIFRLLREQLAGRSKKMKGNKVKSADSFVRKYDVSNQNFVIDRTAGNTRELEKKFVKCMKEHLKLNKGSAVGDNVNISGDAKKSKGLKDSFIRLLDSYTVDQVDKTITDDNGQSIKIVRDGNRVNSAVPKSTDSGEKIHADERNLLLLDDSFYVTSLENNVLENRKMELSVKMHNFKIIIKKTQQRTDEEIEVVKEGPLGPSSALFNNEKMIETGNFSPSSISDGIKDVETKIFNLDEQIQKEFSHDGTGESKLDIKEEDRIIEEYSAASDRVVQESGEQSNTNITEYHGVTAMVNTIDETKMDMLDRKVVEEDQIVLEKEGAVAGVAVSGDESNAENIKIVEITDEAKVEENVENVFMGDVIEIKIDEDPERELEKELKQRIRTQYVEGTEIKSIEVPVTEKKVFSLYEPYHDYNFERLFYQFHIEECESLKEFGHANIIGKMHYRSETNFFNFNWVKLSERKLFCYKPEFSYIRRGESDLLSPSLNEKFHALDFAVELEGAKLFLYSAPTFTLQNAIKLFKCNKISEFMDITNFHVVNVTPKGSKYLVDISNDHIRKQFMIKDLSFTIESSDVKYFFRVETLKAFINWLACLYMRIHNLKGFV